MTTRPVVFVLEPSRPADVVVYEHDELGDALDALLRVLRSGPERVVVDLRPKRVPVPFSPGDFLWTTRSLTSGLDYTLELVVASARVAEHLQRHLLWAVGERPRWSGTLGEVTVVVVVGNIVVAQSDAIVNASSTTLRLDVAAGVSAAIRRAVGPDAAAGLQRAMYALAPIAPGRVVVTSSFGLPAPWILHAATASGAVEDVASAYRQILDVAVHRRWSSLATPALGTGTGRLPAPASADALVRALREQGDFGALRELRVVVVDERTFQAFQTALAEIAR